MANGRDKREIIERLIVTFIWFLHGYYSDRKCYVIVNHNVVDYLLISLSASFDKEISYGYGLDEGATKGD